MAGGVLEEIRQREQDYRAQFVEEVDVCLGTACLSSGGVDLFRQLKKMAAESQGSCRVKCVGCRGLCARGPLVEKRCGPAAAPVTYGGVTVPQATEILNSCHQSTTTAAALDACTPFFRLQRKTVLENAGIVDPESIRDYISRQGYFTLARVLQHFTPQQVIDEIGASGLRGRGGAGFPTGRKWQFLADAASENGEKFLICNGDEGDPGAFMDRSIMEADPHRILEGLTLAAYATGATHGFIYVRAEYPLAVKRLTHAIAQAHEIGVLGESILDSSFCFDIEVRLGAGAFVCGEEMALIASIEGRRGNPSPRPPFPTQCGLWGKPTAINNVETLANVVPILSRGSDWFSAIGVGKSRGTKVFALAGQVVNSGLIEVPMGTTLRQIVFEIGGGIPHGKRFKAVQTGGPSGGVIPEQFLDTPIAYESLQELGSIMGSGGMLVMSEDNCMVDMAKFYLKFCVAESCGKCAPCRLGGYQMLQILERIMHGRGRMEDLDLLTQLGESMQKTSLCGLGQTAANPVISTLRYFRHEYEAYITGGVKYAREMAKRQDSLH